MRQKGFVYATIASVLIGALIVVNKAALNRSIDPFVLVLATYVVAAVWSIPFLLKQKQILRSLSKPLVVRLIILGVVSTGIAPVVQIWGQRFTSAVNASFLATLSALFTVVFSSLLLKERVFKRNYFFVLPLFSGIYLLLVGFAPVTPTLGDGLIIIGALFFGFSNSLARTLMNTLSALTVAQIQVVLGTLLLILIFIFFGPKGRVDVLSQWPWYIATGTLTWLITLMLYKGFDFSGPVMTMFVTLSYPLVATIGSFLFLKEAVRTPQALGGVLILWSIYKIVKGQNSNIAI
ncbi:DMT family transporter [Candidatus Gottesmanbacteria bacterium]|nr:DMT family transporter [Candidatus Gottesmanbacteria bacterium]